MKTKLLTLAFAALAFGACKKETNLEIKQIHDTKQTDQWKMNVTRSVFSAADAGTEKGCTEFNEEISGLVNGIRAAFIEQSKANLAGLDSIGEKQLAPYELLIGDSVFMADRHYISVRLWSYEMTGGANGTNNFYGLNYDVKNQKFLEKSDILNMGKAAGINALLKANLHDPDQCFTFEAPTVENVTAVNITHETIVFTYNKYILGPGACGIATISIPRTQLKDMLALQ